MKCKLIKNIVLVKSDGGTRFIKNSFTEATFLRQLCLSRGNLQTNARQKEMTEIHPLGIMIIHPKQRSGNQPLKQRWTCEHTNCPTDGLTCGTCSLWEAVD